MALTTEGVSLWLTENLGELAAKVYEQQRGIDNSAVFSQMYHDAYAYGPEDKPQKIFNKASATGARWLEMDPQEYRLLWHQACRCIESYWDIPEEFRDKDKYENGYEAPIMRALRES